VPERGVLAPEQLLATERFDAFMAELATCGVHIRYQQTFGGAHVRHQQANRPVAVG
jgi:hypothetical protein